jgi:hypothetical protein
MLHQAELHRPAFSPPLWARLLATWLLSGLLLGVVLGPAISVPVGLIIALGYVAALDYRVRIVIVRRTVVGAKM